MAKSITTTNPKCKCEAQGNCSGKVHGFNRFNVSLCKYHGELMNKLQTMTLVQLEKLYKNVVWKNAEPVYIEDARRLALCGGVTDFHKHAENVYKGTYDYTKH